MIRTAIGKSGTLVDNLLDLGSICISLAIIVTVAAGVTGLARAFLVLAFVLFVPGHAIVRVMPERMRSLQRSRDSRSQIVIPMLLSVSLVALVASMALWLHFWHPWSIFVFEAEASFVLILAGFINRLMS